MVAVDGFPLRKFCSSEVLRKLLTSVYKCSPPKSPTGITTIMTEKYDEKKRELTKQIQTMKKNGDRFVVSLDVWTSTHNRRYMNVILHGDFGDLKFKNQGLLRIIGSMPAEAGLNYLEQRLAQYGLTLNDIVCLVTDGASVMTKMWRLFGGQQQLCMAHGINVL